MKTNCIIYVLFYSNIHNSRIICIFLYNFSRLNILFVYSTFKLNKNVEIKNANTFFLSDFISNILQLNFRFSSKYKHVSM